MRRLNPKKEGKGKKGISPLIGYVLLVVFAVVISSIVFQWLRTYVPAQAMECPDGVSLFLNNATFDSGELSLTITNNGRFSIDGYFINIKNDSEQELAVIGIWNYLDKEKSSPAQNFSGYVSFSLQENSFEPQNQTTHIFDIPEEYGEPYSVSIIPTRRQEHRERERLVSCGGARVEEVISPGTGEEEPPETCGDGTCDDGECNSCPQDCIHADCCPDGTCNNGETCGDTNDEPECNLDCGTCPIESSCNGIWEGANEDTGVECDGGAHCIIPGEINECTCESGYNPDGSGGCIASINSCEAHCDSLGYDGDLSGCALNCGGGCDGTCESGGDQYCSEPMGNCCCVYAKVILLEDGFEGEDWDANWDDNGETDWDHATDKKNGGSYSAENIGGFFIFGDNDLISDDLDASDADKIQIFFWYNKDDLDNGDFYIQIFDGNNYDPLQDLDLYAGEDNCAGDGGDDKWCRFNETITDSQYFKNNFRLKFEGTGTDNNERVWIDDVSIIKSY